MITVQELEQVNMDWRMESSAAVGEVGENWIL